MWIGKRNEIRDEEKENMDQKGRKRRRREQRVEKATLEDTEDKKEMVNIQFQIEVDGEAK